MDSTTPGDRTSKYRRRGGTPAMIPHNTASPKLKTSFKNRQIFKTKTCSYERVTMNPKFRNSLKRIKRWRRKSGQKNRKLDSMCLERR